MNEAAGGGWKKKGSGVNSFADDAGGVDARTVYPAGDVDLRQIESDAGQGYSPIRKIQLRKADPPPFAAGIPLISLNAADRTEIFFGDAQNIR